MKITGRPNAQKRDHAIHLLREAGLALREAQQATGGVPAMWRDVIPKIDDALRLDQGPEKDPIRPSKRRKV